MNRLLLVAVAMLLAVPSFASAATVRADLERRQGTLVGPVTFKAARGEVNDLTVSTTDTGRLRFHDEENPVDARGDCKQAGARAAVCPFSEDVVKVRLRDRGDAASVEVASTQIAVLAGKGFDILRGADGPDMLSGQRGADVLRGMDGEDELTGGPGEDVVFGGADDDLLVDGETDAQAATDIYRGGTHRRSASPGDGDAVSYASRRRNLEIDLGAKQVSAGPEGDDLVGIEGLGGGAGDDRLFGNAGKNPISGGPGDDVIRGRGGNDIVDGNRGDDRVGGGSARDVVWGGGGTDSLAGGGGDDSLISRDSSPGETVRCGRGDDEVLNGFDFLVGCEVASAFQRAGGTLYVKVQPAVDGDTATFQVSCQDLDPCDGFVNLSGPNGEDYGSGSFAGLPNDPRTFSDVEVPLTQAGVEALAEGARVLVSLPRSGYSAFMQG